jgi:ubiquinone/menaquinone biosynthesis C-methylase UbiE
MGVWSRMVGADFLDWLAPQRGLHWLDVGCGNGAFDMVIAERCAPAMINGIDPSEAQLSFARTRLPKNIATFETGNAMALPVEDDSFDVAVMPLVIFFVPDPVVGVREMARVVRGGGVVASYSWDIPGGGFPYAPVNEEMTAMGIEVPSAPSADASRIDRLLEHWADAGLEQVETREFTVQRSFADFDDYWNTIIDGPSAGRQIRALSDADRARFIAGLRERLPSPDANGRMTMRARANAVKGRVSGRA